jgi:predicted nucleic acid-binding protein
VAVRTYIDTGVLIAAFHGDHAANVIALSYLKDPLREYVTSDYVKVELLPKSIFHKQAAERTFYEDFFKPPTIRVPSSDALLAFAIREGGKTGISGMDAVHVACALVAQAAELITTERTTKPIHKANGIKIISISPPVSAEVSSPRPVFQSVVALASLAWRYLRVGVVRAVVRLYRVFFE